MQHRVRLLENKLFKKYSAMDVPLWQRERMELGKILKRANRGEELTPEEQERLDQENERTANILNILYEIGAIPHLQSFLYNPLSRTQVR